MDLQRPHLLRLSDDAPATRLSVCFGDERIAGSFDKIAVQLGDERLATGALISSHREESEAGGHLVRVYALLDTGGGVTEWRVEQSYQLLKEPPCVRRRVRLHAGATATRTALRQVSLFVHQMTAGDADRTTVSVPMARLVPGTPLTEVAKRPRRFASHRPNESLQADVCTSAPDTGLGAVCFERASPPLHVTLLPTPERSPVRTFVYGDDTGLVVEHEFATDCWIGGEISAIDIGSQTLHVAACDWREAIPAVRRASLDADYAPPTDRPDSAKSLAIMEIDLQHFGGLRATLDRLDQIQSWGFDTLYLMPWHAGGYGTADYEEVDPAYGTSDDLRALTAAAHQRGMRVLFDLLVNITHRESAYVARHPDWYYRDEGGSPLPHPAWKGACLDPASPGFRRFLIDYAVRCCREWGADGFRVDAVAYRGGCWNNQAGLQPRDHAHAVFSLVGEIRDAIRRVNPQAILLAECFGPAQVPISDLVCYQWVDWLDWMLSGVIDSRLRGVDVQRLLAEQFLALPTRTWFTTYTHTHDSRAFVGRELDGPRVEAMMTTLALISAGFMQFAGGWRMRDRPGTEEVRHYQSLLKFRKSLGGVAGADLSFPPSHPDLLVVTRPSLLGNITVITNLGSEVQALDSKARILYQRDDSSLGAIAPLDTVVLAEGE